MSSMHCYVCGELGHAHCDSASSAPATALTQISCSNCGLAGHASVECGEERMDLHLSVDNYGNVWDAAGNAVGGSDRRNSRGGPGSARKDWRADAECFYCNQKGHLKFDCPKKKSDAEKFGANASRRHSFTAVGGGAGGYRAATPGRNSGGGGGGGHSTPFSRDRRNNNGGGGGGSSSGRDRERDRDRDFLNDRSHDRRSDSRGGGGGGDGGRQLEREFKRALDSKRDYDRGSDHHRDRARENGREGRSHSRSSGAGSARNRDSKSAPPTKRR